MSKIEQASKTIANTYGYEHQSRQLIEEMAELTQAINKEWRGTTDSLDNIVEEIADVEICIEQVKYLLDSKIQGGIETMIDQIKDRKLKREIGRIEVLHKQDIETWSSVKRSQIKVVEE